MGQRSCISIIQSQFSILLKFYVKGAHLNAMYLKFLCMKFFLFPLLFLFIYSPFIMVGDLILKLSIFIHFIFLIIGFPSALVMYRKYPVFRKALNILIANFCIMFFLFMLHDVVDIDGLRLSLSGIISLIGAAFFIQRYHHIYFDRSASKLIFDVFIVGVLHSIIIIGIMIYLPFGDWMKDTFFYTDKTLFHWTKRSPGLSVSGFGALSLSQAMTGILGLILLFTLKGNNLGLLSRIFILLGLPLIMLSIFFTGRIGLIAFALSFVLFILLNIKLIFWRRQNRRIFLALMLEIVTILSAIIIIAYSDIENYSQIFQWSLEFYFRYENEGSIATGSTNIVLDSMYFIPEELFSILFGEGNFGRLEPPLPSDVGYVIMIFGAGILGLISMLMVYAYFMLKSISSLRLIPMMANSVLLVILMLILANFKDPFFFHIYGTNQILCILFALMSIVLFNYNRDLKIDSFVVGQPR